MTVRPEEHLDLNSQYRFVRYLDQGGNDIAYLVRDGENNLAVALRPKESLFGWNKLRNKYAKVTELDKLGLREHLVHQLSEGTLNLSGQNSEVLVVEYGGKPLESLSGEKPRLEAARQVFSVLQTLHANGYAINDFKHEHWVFEQMRNGKVQVKLIDYTQIAKVQPDWIRNDTNDHRKSDLRSFSYLLETLFPWFSPSIRKYGLPYDPLAQQAGEDLQRLELQSANFSFKDKAIRRLINSIRF